MFQLIVAVISIVLVAALAIASIYYGGAAFNSSSTQAQVDTLLNGAQQIIGAEQLYIVETGNSTPAMTDLTPTYLSAAPVVPAAAASGTWTLVGGNVNLTLDGPGTAAIETVLDAANTTSYGHTGTTFYFNE